MVSHPVRSEDSISLQCSVLTDSACPSDRSVHLTGVKSDKSHGTIIYAEGNKQDECDKKLDERSSPKSCVYHFSKNVSSSDPENYYCAVATCGEILFGNGTRLDTEGKPISNLFNKCFIFSPSSHYCLCDQPLIG